MAGSSIMSFARRALVCLVLVAMAAPASAQDAGVAAEFYGRGVHDYFARRFVDAHENLTTAINAEKEAKDPRMFYFRGLTYLRLGRDDEAQQDFEKAAALESTAVGDLSRDQPIARTHPGPRPPEARKTSGEGSRDGACQETRPRP